MWINEFVRVSSSISRYKLIGPVRTALRLDISGNLFSIGELGSKTEYGRFFQWAFFQSLSLTIHFSISFHFSDRKAAAVLLIALNIMQMGPSYIFFHFTLINWLQNYFEIIQSKRKWIEMDRNSFCSCQIQILIFRIHFYSIKISEFLKIHFNLYERIKINSYSFQFIKNMQTINSF